MIRHIVMFKLKPLTEKKENTRELKKRLDALKKSINEIAGLETGLNISTRPVAYDLVLITDFRSHDDLKKYIDHPEHQKVVEYLQIVNESVVVVDYEI